MIYINVLATLQKQKIVKSKDWKFSDKRKNPKAKTESQAWSFYLWRVKNNFLTHNYL